MTGSRLLCCHSISFLGQNISNQVPSIFYSSIIRNINIHYPLFISYHTHPPNILYQPLLKGLFYLRLPSILLLCLSLVIFIGPLLSRYVCLERSGLPFWNLRGDFSYSSLRLIIYTRGESLMDNSVFQICLTITFLFVL